VVSFNSLFKLAIRESALRLPKIGSGGLYRLQRSEDGKDDGATGSGT
jgi:hypothetical protein